MKLLSKLKNTYKSNAKLFNNILGSGVIRCAAIVISLMTTPAYMQYFDNQSILGTWLTVVSVTDAITAMDLGLGIGLRNKLTESITKDDREQSRTLISTSYILMTLFSLVVLPVLLLLVRFVDLDIFFTGVAIQDMGQLRMVLSVLMISVLLQMVLRLINSVLFALQEAAFVNAFPLITSVAMLIFVKVMPSGDDVSNLQNLAYFSLVAANLPYLLLNIVLFSKKLRWCCPRIKDFSVKAAKTVLKLGMLFFYLTLMSMITHNTNEILISSLIDTSSVVDYQIYNKIFNMITSIVNVLMIPLWSATTKALAEKNYDWLDKTHKTLCFAAIGVFLVGLAVIPFMQIAINIWLGENSIPINPLLAIPFAVFIAENALNGANATVANGANWIKLQMWVAPISALLNFPLTFLFNTVFHHWVAIIFANIVSLLPIAIGQFIYVRKKIQKAKLGA